MNSVQHVLWGKVPGEVRLLVLHNVGRTPVWDTVRDSVWQHVLSNVSHNVKETVKAPTWELLQEALV